MSEKKPDKTPKPPTRPVDAFTKSQKAMREADRLPHAPGTVLIARRRMSYGTTTLDHGQVFTLTGMIGDERLVRLGYAAPAGEGPFDVCAACAAKFAGAGFLEAHGRAKHAARPRTREIIEPRGKDESIDEFVARQQDFERALEQMSPADLEHMRSVAGADELQDREEEERLNRLAPLNLQNSKASREESIR